LEQIQPYLEYFSNHPGWAIAIIFLIAFGEALLIIGLFVPSTAVLVGAGVLVGTGHLAFWPVFAATFIGAVAGDQVSYWAGRLYGQHLKVMWPLRLYPSLVERGEGFVKAHGGKSIAIGRFVPGVKAVVPGIVGMLGMSQLFFVIVNVVSGFVWSLAHVVPGILLGQGLSIAGDLSGRLAVMLLGLLVFLGFTGWFARLAAAGLAPLMRVIQVWMARRFKAFGSRPYYRLGRVLDPKHPRSARLVKFGLGLFIAVAGLVYLGVTLALRDAASNLDRSVNTLLSELRSAPADDFLVPMTMMGDTIMILLLFSAVLLWLLWHRSWRISVAVVLAVAAEQILVSLLKSSFARPRPLEQAIDGLQQFASFPSGHAAFATLAFGLLTVIAGRTMGRWSKALVASMALMAICLIGFSRLYLGVHWLSDVLAGMLLGAVLVALFGFIIEAIPARRIRPVGFLGFVLLIYFGGGIAYVNMNGERQYNAYVSAPQVKVIGMTELTVGLTKLLPSQRVDLAGRPEEVFVARWAGALGELQQLGHAQNWHILPKWTWRDAISYLDPHTPLRKMAPKPLLHEGLKAVLTAIVPQDQASEGRLVLRVYKTRAEVANAGVLTPVFLLSLTREVLRQGMKIYSIPALEPATLAETDALQNLLQNRIGTRLLAQQEFNGQKQLVLLSP
jgi:membrane protein DedA with SNARE-associated domain/membrane-associated phospholipid phosphatase